MISSLYLGEGNMEKYLVDLLFNRMETPTGLKVSLMFDFHRSCRANKYTGLQILRPLQTNFKPNPNLRIGFYRNPNPF